MNKTINIDDDLFGFDSKSQTKVQLIFKSGATQVFHTDATPLQFIEMWNLAGKTLKLLTNSTQIVYIKKREVAYYSATPVDNVE